MGLPSRRLGREYRQSTIGLSRRGVASMVRASLVGIVVLVATATTAAAAPGQPAFDEAELTSGSALALAPAAAPVAVPTPDEAVALDADMQAFVAPLKAVRDPRRRLQALIAAMEGRGMFSLEYAEVTRTARDTFHDRRGNCLSFTMLFVALARAAELRASYQSVEVPPSWTYDGTVVIASHVNTAVRTGNDEETVVDFNIRQYEGRQPSRPVDDTYALSLFYTNLGAEALLQGDYAAALVYLRGAAAVNADLAGLWINLGVLYARNGKYEHAEAAYLRALETDENEPSALANLALVYQALGKAELAAEYRERVQSYRERNPYITSRRRRARTNSNSSRRRSRRCARRFASSPTSTSSTSCAGVCRRRSGSHATRCTASSARASTRKPRHAHAGARRARRLGFALALG